MSLTWIFNHVHNQVIQYNFSPFSSSVFFFQLSDYSVHAYCAKQHIKNKGYQDYVICNSIHSVSGCQINTFCLCCVSTPYPFTLSVSLLLWWAGWPGHLAITLLCLLPFHPCPALNRYNWCICLSLGSIWFGWVCLRRYRVAKSSHFSCSALE